LPKPPGGEEHPEHPIVIPPTTPLPPNLPEFPIGGAGWSLKYVPGYGWVVVPPPNWTVPPLPPGTPPPTGGPPATPTPASTPASTTPK